MTLRVALCYPNRPAVGRANLGLAIVRDLLATLGQPLAIEERYAGGPRRAQRPLDHFDLIVCSVPFEGDYPRLIELLVAGGVEPLAARRPDGPSVLVGGMAPTLNPEPLALIADLIAIGEAEELLPELTATIGPLLRARARRDEMLSAAAEVSGVYVPDRLRFEYDAAGRIAGIGGAQPGRELPRVARRWIADLDRAGATAPVIADDEVFAGCAVIEATRGCLWGCRFCAAGFAQRPFRQRRQEALWPDVERALGLRRRVGLVGADLGDLNGLPELTRRIHAAGGTLTPSALRATAVDAALAQALAASGKKLATLAPETGSERLRRLINKPISDEKLLAAVDELAGAGIESIRLYFMIGLPTETDDDVAAMVALGQRARSQLLQHGRRRGRVGGVTLSVTPFVPKPATPFQWEPVCDAATLKRRMRLLRRAGAGVANLEIKVEPLAATREQAILSRADRRIGALLVEAVERRVPLRRLLDDHPEICGPPLAGFGEKDLLPWQQVDHGAGRDYLWRERQRAFAGQITPPCDLGRCNACALECGERARSPRELDGSAGQTAS
ncbi:MAG: radical SAM protein [Deltaproteobacteria bacterium]|nr:radical SAM protein [Deltaproteobacteria bacterium]